MITTIHAPGLQIPTKPVFVGVLFVLLAGCSTQSAVTPVPMRREEPINSLALEQCIRENGAEKCPSEGN